MEKSINDLTQYGDLNRTDLQQFCSVTAKELQDIFGVDDETLLACRQGRQLTVAGTEQTVTQATYDSFNGRYNVDHWVGK